MATSPSNDGRSYWASEPSSDIAAANIIERVRKYRQWLRESGRADRMVRGFTAFYGHGPDGTGDTNRTSSSGEQGEYIDVTTNKYAALVTQSTVRTTAEKPAFRAIATNADSASLEEASFAQGLLDVYSNTLAIADRDYEMVQTGDICMEGWEILGWDTTKGKNLTDFAEGAPLNEGDVDVHASTPFRVAYDPDCESVDRLKWVAFKRRFNRFDLSASIKERYPEAAEKLLDMGGGNQEKEWEDNEDNLSIIRTTHASTSTDLVWVWEFRHLPTASLPKGRLLRYVTAECVVFDSFETKPGENGEVALTDHGYPYDEDLHAYRYSPQTVLGSIAGHAPSVDLLGLQELKDTVATMAASAANAGGVSNMWVGLGPKPTLGSVIGSFNFIQSANKPELLEGPQLSPQVPAFDLMLDKTMQERMGESDVSMGNVPKGMPGNLAALLEAKTVQYNSRGQASYAHVLERSRTGMLKLLQRFATSERVAVLGGKANGYKHVTWTNEKLKGVDRFVVEAVSPLSQTYSGKMEAADRLLDKGLVADANQYLLLRETGRLEPLLESTEASLMSMRREKEMLQQGIGLPDVDPMASFEKGMPVFVDDRKPHIRPLMYDKHWSIIPEDLGVLAIPSTRDNPKIVQAVTGVVEERVRLLGKMSQLMLAVLGAPPEIREAVMMTQNPMMMGMGPTGTPPPKPGAPSETKQPEVAGLPVGAPRIAAPKPAAPPKNPLTGEQSPSPVEIQ